MGLEIFDNLVFYNEIEPNDEIKSLIGSNEQIYKAFKTFRDVAVFTNKRLIITDKQGLTGMKKEIYSLPYKNVLMWSTENAGMLDSTSEVELWTKVMNIKIKLSRDVDVREFDRLLAEVCL